MIAGFPAPLTEQARQKTEQDKSDVRGDSNPEGGKTTVGFGRWD